MVCCPYWLLSIERQRFAITDGEENMAEQGTQSDTGDETYVQSKNVKYVLMGIIVVLLIIVGLQYRELQTAQDVINTLAKHVPEIQKKQ